MIDYDFAARIKESNTLQGECHYIFSALSAIWRRCFLCEFSSGKFLCIKALPEQNALCDAACMSFSARVTMTMEMKKPKVWSVWVCDFLCETSCETFDKMKTERVLQNGNKKWKWKKPILCHNSPISLSLSFSSKKKKRWKNNRRQKIQICIWW